MAKLLKLRRGTTSQHSSFTGAEGEVTIDTTKDTAVVHDGSQAGGRPLLREDLSNLPAGTIDNADINASAAIAGTKISPDFGSQNIVTTGGLDIGALADTTTNSYLKIAIQDTDGLFKSDDTIKINPAQNALSVSGMFINSNTVRASGNGPVTITNANSSGTVDLVVKTTHVESNGNLLPATDSTDNLGSDGVRWANVYADTLYGDGSNLTGIAGIPSGVIAMWSGATSAIPSGWVLCDGNNSTPDLRDRFVAGASAGTGDTSWPGINPGATGGATDTTVQVSVNGNTGWASQYANASSMPNASPEPFNSRDRHQHSWGGTFTSGTIPTLPPYYALAFIMKS